MSRTLDPEKRAKFLETALRLFAASNVHATTTADITRQAGAATGTLFLYFPTKQDLIHALVLQISRKQAQAVQNALSPALSARDTFFAIWDASIRWFLDNPAAYHFVQQIRHAGMVAQPIVQESARDLAYYFSAVEKGRQEDVIKPYSPELIGAYFYQAIVAVIDYLDGVSDPAMQDAAIRQGFDIFWDGIRLHEIP